MFNILVIEDNKNMRKLICATLKQNGYSTFEAEDGEVGLDVLDTTHIDLIICDIMMPNMDGYEFTETLRDGHCEIPIIIVTAKEQLEDKKKGKTKIDKQFEYNTYIRDFFADNKGKSLEEAIKCWKYKKQLQGHNRYERTDLVAIEW